MTTTFSCSIIKPKSCCNLNYIKDVKRAKIDLSSFQEIDTIVGTGDFATKYNRLYICENGTVILGNVDSIGRMYAEWSFDKENSTGYEGHITGEFKNGKMDGYWSHGSYSSLYKNGRLKETTQIPF